METVVMNYLGNEIKKLEKNNIENEELRILKAVRNRVATWIAIEGKIERKTRAGSLCCWNSDCKHYFEDLCFRELAGDAVYLDYLSTCTSFVPGKNEGYTDLEKMEEEE